MCYKNIESRCYSRIMHPSTVLDFCNTILHSRFVSYTTLRVYILRGLCTYKLSKIGKSSIFASFLEPKTVKNHPQRRKCWAPGWAPFWIKRPQDFGLHFGVHFWWFCWSFFNEFLCFFLGRILSSFWLQEWSPRATILALQINKENNSIY